MIDYHSSLMMPSIFSKKGLAAIGSFFILAFSLPFAASITMQFWTADLMYESAEAVPAKQVALVLGAAAYPSRLSDILQDRMDTAIDLYKTEKVQKLILSGAPNEAQGMKRYALEKGVEENDIIEDPRGINTMASIQNADGKKGVIIVTQKYHLPRALFIARHAGMDAIGLASYKRSYIKIFDFKKRELLASSKAMVDLYFLLPLLNR